MPACQTLHDATVIWKIVFFYLEKTWWMFIYKLGKSISVIEIHIYCIKRTSNLITYHVKYHVSYHSVIASRFAPIHFLCSCFTGTFTPFITFSASLHQFLKKSFHIVVGSNGTISLIFSDWFNHSVDVCGESYCFVIQFILNSNIGGC